ncbi:MAG: ferrous iron transporter B [Clostridia bacterium]|nr:ferrous iron transporter B [Clostridia bacterium]
MKEQTVVLAGTPNVGKSTLFNALTGLRQHTGNWPGKTVERAEGYFENGENKYRLVDLPGCYSLFGRSPEEELAADYLKNGEAERCIAVIDATAPERGLALALQILSLQKNGVLCVNLIDEAQRKGIDVDLDKLRELLGVPVVGTAAGRKRGLKELSLALRQDSWPLKLEAAEGLSLQEAAVLAAERLAAECVVRTKEQKVSWVDRLLTGKWTAFPCLMLLLAGIFWLTIEGASYPSELLQKGLFALEKMGYGAFVSWGIPPVVCELLWHGVWRVTAWVVSVMLPPMAIFFPLFTLAEDLGLLPRVAFDMDHAFQKCNACGKQSLCMMMGLGCNAVGVVGCRIIDSPRERKMAMLTNVFIPCNGRLPMLMTLLGLITIGMGSVSTWWAALCLAGLILLGIAATFLSCRLLSRTVFKGESSPLTLELPPYRRPAVGQILVRSIIDRTLFVLGRAVCVAAPAGVVIWCLSNISIGGGLLMDSICQWLTPVGVLLGMDGVILTAFILGWPAGEIVLPLMLMGYTGAGVLQAEAGDLSAILFANGWTAQTVVCVLLFCLMHWPCTTTLLTIKKESGSLALTALAVLLPTMFGIVSCLLVNILL